MEIATMPTTHGKTLPGCHCSEEARVDLYNSHHLKWKEVAGIES